MAKPPPVTLDPWTTIVNVHWAEGWPYLWVQFDWADYAPSLGLDTLYVKMLIDGYGYIITGYDAVLHDMFTIKDTEFFVSGGLGSFGFAGPFAGALDNYAEEFVTTENNGFYSRLSFRRTVCTVFTGNIAEKEPDQEKLDVTFFAAWGDYFYDFYNQSVFPIYNPELVDSPHQTKVKMRLRSVEKKEEPDDLQTLLTSGLPSSSSGYVTTKDFSFNVTARDEGYFSTPINGDVRADMPGSSWQELGTAKIDLQDGSFVFTVKK